MDRPPIVGGRQATGWRHNHGRVRLLSAGQLERMLTRAGFTEPRFGTHAAGTVDSRFRRRFGRYFGLAARRPDVS